MMRRMFCGVVLGFVTFAAGLNADSVWRANRALSLCELNASPDALAGKTIRFRALVGGIPDFVSAGSACNVEDNDFAWVDIEFDSGELEKFPSDVVDRQARTVRRSHLTDAIIVGRLDQSFGLGCFAPKYRVKNARVERIISSRAFDGSQDSVEWFKSNSY